MKKWLLSSISALTLLAILAIPVWAQINGGGISGGFWGTASNTAVKLMGSKVDQWVERTCDETGSNCFDWSGAAPGTGDMIKAVYDPSGVNGDAFDEFGQHLRIQDQEIKLVNLKQ